MRILVFKTALLIGAGLSVALAGCTRTSNLNQGGFASQQRAATPLKPAPLTPVQGAKLQPVSPTPPPAGGQVAANGVPVTDPAVDPNQPAAQQPVEVAKVEPTDSKPVTRQSMVGAWTVSTGGSNCQIFLALTKWSGGYRAASRGCSAKAISDVQAWDVKGKQVVLVNSSGGTAATLFRSAGERFDGSTSGGGAISFSR